MALCRAAKQIEELARFIDDKTVADEMRKIYDEMFAIINNNGWDGDWYLAAFNDEGTGSARKRTMRGMSRSTARPGRS